VPRIARRGIESSERLGRHRWVVEVVFTQLAKADVLAVRAGREDVADLDLSTGDDHAVHEQHHELATLLEVGVSQSSLHAGPERLQ
jgi:hypothetical protein